MCCGLIYQLQAIDEYASNSFSVEKAKLNVIGFTSEKVTLATIRKWLSYTLLWVRFAACMA